MGVVEFCPQTEMRDANALMTKFDQEWYIEPELDLMEGCIRLWRVDGQRDSPNSDD